MRNIAIITARSGSKGLKDKNIKELCGKPLLAYSIECALRSKQFEKVFVSTDSSHYAQIAERYGADASFLRTAENSGDRSGSWDVVREVIEMFEKKKEFYDNIMLLQPTSPLRTEEDICRCFSLMEEKGANAIVSVCETDHSPLWCNKLEDDLCMDNFRNEKYSGLPRQALPTYYRINGAAYLIKREELNRSPMFENHCYAYIMPRERSIDIDTEYDFKIAEVFMKERKRCLNREIENDVQIIELKANEFDSWSDDISRLLRLSLDNSISDERKTDAYANKKISGMKDYLKNDDTVAFLACIEEKTVGWIWCHEIMRLDEKMLHIAFFSVLPEYQGRGIGSKLLAEAENYAINAHYIGLDLLVVSSNENAISVYEQNGFETDKYLMKKVFL